MTNFYLPSLCPLYQFLQTPIQFRSQVCLLLFTPILFQSQFHPLAPKLTVKYPPQKILPPPIASSLIPLSKITGKTKVTLVHRDLHQTRPNIPRLVRFQILHLYHSLLLLPPMTYTCHNFLQSSKQTEHQLSFLLLFQHKLVSLCINQNFNNSNGIILLPCTQLRIL